MSTFPTPSHDSIVQPSPHVGEADPVAPERTLTRKSSAATEGLHARTLRQQVQSCFTKVIPIALNTNGNLTTTFGTPGMLMLHETCVDVLRAADISFENAIFVHNTMRRLNSLVDREQNITQDQLRHLHRIVIELGDRAEDACSLLRDANRRQQLLLSSTKEFMPNHEQQLTNFPLPQDLEEGDVTLRIVKLIKAQMSHMVGNNDTPDIFTDLHALIVHSDTWYLEREAIVTWIDNFAEALTRVAQIIAEEPLHRWKDLVTKLYEKSFEYMAQIPVVNERISKEEQDFLAGTRAAITKLRHTATSVDEIQPKPIHKWQADDIDSTSRAILSRRTSAPGIPNQTVDFLVMMTRVEKLSTGRYGLAINVKSHLNNLNPSKVDDSARIRCDELEITVNLRQPESPSANGLRGLRITNYQPSHESYNSKLGSGAPGVNVQKADLGVESESKNKATLIMRNYSVAESEQTKEDCVHWKLVRNQDSSTGISDCDLAMIVDAPGADIEVDVHLKAQFNVEGTRRFKMIPFLTCTGKTMSLNITNGDPTIINGESEALVMELFSTEDL